MINGKRILVVIPARGGSKGIYKKNIAPLKGKPLIEYTFEQLNDVSCIDTIVVSTDCPEIQDFSESCGVKVVKRPPEISLDTSKTEECLLHCLSVLSDEGLSYDYLAILEPTSPLRRPSTILKCLNIAVEEQVVSLLTVKETFENIGKMNAGCFYPFDTKNARRRQDRDPCYIESSTVYVVSVRHFLKNKTIVAPSWRGVVIETLECVDINTPQDLQLAEFFLGQMVNGLSISNEAQEFY